MPPRSPNHATLVVVGPELWSTYAVFNANAFPEDLSSIVDSCALRLGMLVALASTLRKEIDEEWTTLATELLADRGELSASILQSKVPIIAFADGVQYMGVMYSFLATVKSFLDVYAMLMGKLIGRNLTWSFKRARVGADELSGGAIVNWLRRSAPHALESARSLAAAVESHSKSWATEVIAFRDTTSHYSEIRGMQHLSVPLRRVRPLFDPSERRLPMLPGDRPLTEYAVSIIASIRQLVEDTVTLLPGIDLQHIHPERLLAQR